MITLNKVTTVVPNDGANLPNNDGDCVAIMCTVAGNIRVTMGGGSLVTLPINANEIYYLRITKVWAAGTTATGIFAFYQPVKLFNID